MNCNVNCDKQHGDGYGLTLPHRNSLPVFLADTERVIVASVGWLALTTSSISLSTLH